MVGIGPGRPTEDNKQGETSNRGYYRAEAHGLGGLAYCAEAYALGGSGYCTEVCALDGLSSVVTLGASVAKAHQGCSHRWLRVARLNQR